MSRRRAIELALQVYDDAADDEKWIAYAIMRAVAERIWGAS